MNTEIIKAPVPNSIIAGIPAFEGRPGGIRHVPPTFAPVAAATVILKELGVPFLTPTQGKCRRHRRHRENYHGLQALVWSIIFISSCKGASFYAIVNTPHIRI